MGFLKFEYHVFSPTLRSFPGSTGVSRFTRLFVRTDVKDLAIPYRDEILTIIRPIINPKVWNCFIEIITRFDLKSPH